jgi:hypothetical protein
MRVSLSNQQKDHIVYVPKDLRLAWFIIIALVIQDFFFSCGGKRQAWNLESKGPCSALRLP